RPAKMLLKGFLVAFVVILGALALLVAFELGRRWGNPGVGDSSASKQDSSAPSLRPGDVANRPTTAPPPPPTVGRPDRLRDILQEGKTYDVITTADLTAPVRSKEWGFTTTVQMAYRAEMHMRRTIEKNDGRRIVELRKIMDCRMLKATSNVDVRFNSTEPGVLVLRILDDLLTKGTVTQIAALVIQPICAVAAGVVQDEITDANTKASAWMDSLSGKTVRIVFEDGQGVVSLEPVGCTLSQEEQDFLFTAAVITDAFLMPDVSSAPGTTWDVDGSAFSDFLPPSWRGTPRGTLRIIRERDFQEGGIKYAMLALDKGTIIVNATDQTKTRLASLTPRGTLKYNITDGHIETAELNAEGSMEEASRDHLLFETRFETSPRVRLTYRCRIVNPMQ
ncbi:MAG: hypothetical protein RMJ82_15130, partial [Gemmatales bacterium]|nr:hypothetical protein [Gemmatales bacterium]